MIDILITGLIWTVVAFIVGVAITGLVMEQLRIWRVNKRARRVR